MLATYDEIMAWYQQRKEAGLTIEPDPIRPLAKSTIAPIIPLCNTCRWHIAGLWGSEYCDGRRYICDCPKWMMYRADDYPDQNNSDPWKDWRKE